MIDYGRQKTDLAVKRAEWRLSRVYRQAAREVEEKTKDWQKAHEARDRRYRQMVKDGKMSKADYDAWMRGQVFQGKQWEARKEQIRQVLFNADKAAMNVIRNGKVGVFSTNANYIGYRLEHDTGINTGFTLYDENTVARLIKGDPKILPMLPPEKAVLKDKAYTYYNKLIANSITQGIIQGESVQQIALRIARDTGEKCYASALRNARTAYTGAQNAGRIEGLHQAQALGIKVKKQWLSTPDERTRDAHVEMDGQVQEVDDPFVSELGEIDYPGDPNAEPANVYNCRCSLIYSYPEYPADMKASEDDVEDMSMDEWKDMKESTKEKSYAANDAIRNTYSSVNFDESASYYINLPGYDEKVLAGLSTAMRDLAIKGSETGYEHLYLVNLVTGEREFYECNDSPNSVGYTFRAHLKEHKHSYYAFVHNHNTDGSFSESDMRTLLNYDQIPVMIAVRNDGVIYVAERRGKTLDTGFFDDMYQKDLQPLQKQLKNGIITMGQRAKQREIIIVDNLLRDYTKGGRLIEYDTRKQKK